MTITLDVPGDVAQRLAIEASRRGLSVDQLVLRAALDHLEGTSPKESSYGVPSHDPHLAAAGARAKTAAQELEALGITNAVGERLKADLPDDMREGADRDFGG
jgi:hypothetical protein